MKVCSNTTKQSTHHLHHCTTELTLKVHLEHLRFDSSDTNNGALDGNQLPDEVGLDVLERRERLEIENPDAKMRIHNTVYSSHNHCGCSQATDCVFGMIQ